ncbi:hypothetical protein RJT34_12969 [Clitoria ternatea]|uniref:glucan endo-1,3-beta-D-glucosidase n=1 Tax=Clitoria ternatea TaxID=43366 RepID=A0AAN9PJU1_CLITE
MLSCGFQCIIHSDAKNKESYPLRPVPCLLPHLNAEQAATEWLQDNVLSYSKDVKFRYIVVGNEISPDDEIPQFVLPAIQNIYAALTSSNLPQIKVSTAISIAFYIDDPKNIELSYALFTSPKVVEKDGNYEYKNLFDTTLGALYSTLEKIGAPDLEVVISESGWPSHGGNAVTVDNAQTYYITWSIMSQVGLQRGLINLWRHIYLPCLMKTRKDQLRQMGILVCSDLINSPSIRFNLHKVPLNLLLQIKVPLNL